MPYINMANRDFGDMLRSIKRATIRKAVNVKRVNLIDYFDLADGLSRAKNICSRNEVTKAGHIYFSMVGLLNPLDAFIDEDNGFNTTKHVARELAGKIRGWINEYVMDDSSPPQIDIEKFDVELPSYQFSPIADKVDHFKSVFTAECRDVEIYSVGQISIYRTSSLVSNASHRIPEECRSSIPDDTMKEFDSAGKCLAFDLPTACGFHALRGLELVILKYLSEFGVKSGKLKTWNDYVKAVQNLIDNEDGSVKPSSKVAAMIDRMRDLDRNPLMHPHDTLDATQSDLLFNLAAITTVEMARDMERLKGDTAVRGLLEDATKSKTKVSEKAKPRSRTRAGS
ncbi:MAG: hypothetical protein MPJ78_11455 [Hyphomicrobiaceae bacterium]|nr:hypothetical protein [Hyphomicrobiaceae bacterium]